MSSVRSALAGPPRARPQRYSQQRLRRPEGGWKTTPVSWHHQCVAALDRGYVLRGQRVPIALECRPDQHRNGLHLLTDLANDADLVGLREFIGPTGETDCLERVDIASGRKGSGILYLADHRKLKAAGILHDHGHLRDHVLVLSL